MKSTYRENPIRNFIRNPVLSVFIALILVFLTSYAFANTEPVASGMLEGDGTRFELTNSAYLNITLASSEPIRVALESVPETVSIHIGPIPDGTFATRTDITLSGFLPDTTYHKYEDDYHNHEEFTTDADGKYTYVQDITVSHLIFILPRKSTKFINSSGGDCASIGTWNSLTLT
ncbi:MAG: hypothetical protein HY883_05045, partial [Deltaproteobacteria bacterium]|nr:hypothetical protein [Deltaproteobacteria bacterium]